MLREFLCCGSADGLKSLTDIDSIHVISQDQQSLWAKQARPVVLELFEATDWHQLYSFVPTLALSLYFFVDQ